MDIHKGILVKEIDDKDNYIYPKSSSDMIAHGENEETTVEAELDKLNNETNINTTNIQNLTTEVTDARLPSSGGDPKVSLNDRLNTDYSHLKDQISTLGGQLSGDINKLTSLINTENRNTKLIVSNYKEISRARKASSDGKVKDNLNERISSDYSALSNKMDTGYDELSDRERIMKKFLKKHIHEIKGSRTALSDNDYKYCLNERLNTDYNSLSSTLNDVSAEITAARSNGVTGVTKSTLKQRLDTDYSVIDTANKEIIAARTNSIITISKNSLKERLDNDYNLLSTRCSNIERDIHNAINSNNSGYNGNTGTLQGRLESDYTQLESQINTNTNSLMGINGVLSYLYLKPGDTYTVDHVFCIGMITYKRKHLGCYIPTPPLIGVSSISTIKSNLESEARILVRVADVRGWTEAKDNIFINDVSDGEIADENGNIYFTDAIETALTTNLSNTTISFKPRKWGIEFQLEYLPGFDVVVNNQPVEVTFRNLKLKMS